MTQLSLHARLIPAHAGSTVLGSRPPGLGWAHPRSRGEHMLKKIRQGPVVGSSPLTRGARFDGVGDGVGAGLIPAHAGSTSALPLRSPERSAHPRSRGEH